MNTAKRLPVVAIVGRPNVGKSTLFNRLVGKRLAIVDPSPGVTRDRREGEGQFGDLHFIVVDTPGFDTHLTRLAHSLADTLVTPLNDSVIDLDVMAHVDPVTGDPREMSHYARLVQRARATGQELSERLRAAGYEPVEGGI